MVNGCWHGRLGHHLVKKHDVKQKNVSMICVVCKKSYANTRNYNKHVANCKWDSFNALIKYIKNCKKYNGWDMRGMR